MHFCFATEGGEMYFHWNTVYLYLTATSVFTEPQACVYSFPCSRYIKHTDGWYIINNNNNNNIKTHYWGSGPKWTFKRASVSLCRDATSFWNCIVRINAVLSKHIPMALPDKILPKKKSPWHAFWDELVDFYFLQR